MTPIHWRYGKYIIRHKWYVLKAGLLVKAPLWRLLIHDWSKLLPCEWQPYAYYFYRKKQGESLAAAMEAQEAFDRAWLHHLHLNAHHWQYHILREDSGITQPIPMPESLIREMVADWMGAGRAVTGRWCVGEWYNNNKEKMLLHPATKLLLEQVLTELAQKYPHYYLESST